MESLHNHNSTEYQNHFKVLNHVVLPCVIYVPKSVCECSTWTANTAPLGNKLLLYSFYAIADLFRWWNMKSRLPPGWRSLLLWAEHTTCSFLQQIVNMKSIFAPKIAQIQMEHIIHLYTVEWQMCDNFDFSRNTSGSIQAQRTAFDG